MQGVLASQRPAPNPECGEGGWGVPSSALEAAQYPSPQPRALSMPGAREPDPAGWA